MKVAKAFSIWLFVFVVIHARAAVVERPMPNVNSKNVWGSPRLFWNVQSVNLVPDGGFENKTNTVWQGGAIVGGGFGDATVEGTNYYRLGPSQNGVLEARRQITLPTTPDRIIWSFAVRNFVDSVYAVVLSTNGPIVGGRVIPQVLHAESFKGLGSLVDGWNTRSVDVSEWAGETVILSVNLEMSAVDAGIEFHLDDVRLTVQPRAMEFDVYLDSSLLGRTTNNWWQLNELLPNKRYSWRVDAIDAGVKTRGPTWRFETPLSHWPRDIEFAELPDSVCPNTFVTIETISRDTYGLRFPTQSGIGLTAYAEHGVLPRLVITEIDMGALDGVEIQNVWTNTVSLGNWTLQLLTMSNGPVTVRMPSGSSLAPGEILKVVEAGANVWPELAMNVNWGEFGTLQAGVILRDFASNVIDCVFIDLTTNGHRLHRAHLSTISKLDWRGGPITNVAGAQQTYQRSRNRNLNNAEDWALAPSSFGAANPGMPLPFDLSFGPWTLLWTNPVTVTAGISSQTTIKFPTAATNVQIVARQGNTINISGISEAFDVAEPGFCLSLLGPSEIREESGTADFRIVLGAPASAGLVVELTSSNPSAVLLPDLVMIAAGQSEANIQAQVINNDLLHGRKSVSLEANALGYTPAKAIVAVIDDETATLKIVGPASVVEGDGSVFTIETTKAPALDSIISITTRPQVRTSETVLIEGATSTTFSILENSYLTGDANVKVRAEYQDWVASELDVFVADAQETVLSLSYSGGRVGEGSSGVVTLSVPVGVGVDLEVALSSSRPDILEVTNRIVIPRISRDAQVPFRVLVNDLPAGDVDVTITATAPTFESAVVAIPTRLYTPGPTLHTTAQADGSIEVTFNVEAGWRYLVVDSEFVDSSEGDSVVPTITGDVARFRVTPNWAARFFYVIKVLQE